MSGELVRVSVPGADDLMAMQSDGIWVALKPMCETLGISFPAQLRKLQGRSWAGVAQKATPSAGGVQMTTVVTSQTVPLWLATIDENRVAPEARAKLIAYQREAADALDAYFNQRTVTAPAVNQFDALRAMIDQLEAAQRDAAEAKSLARLNEARLDSIEGNHGWLTALGYARNNGHPTYEKFLARFSRCAGMIARSHDIEPNKVHHPHFGTVNSYPTWVWDLAAEGFGA
jgi:hypothetical protein